MDHFIIRSCACFTLIKQPHVNRFLNALYTDASNSAFPEGLNFVSAFNVENSPTGDRKSGIPAATLIPAPATTIIRFAFASSFMVLLHISDIFIPCIARSKTSYGRLAVSILSRSEWNSISAGEENESAFHKRQL